MPLDASRPVVLGPPRDGRPARRAIGLKLSEDVLAQLIALARNGVQPDKGTLQIDLGPSPTFIVNGSSYPATLVEEAPHTELLCYAPPLAGTSSSSSSSGWAQRELQRFADVSHKAALKPSTSLDRVGQALREQRSIAEKEREGRRAVLISSAPVSRSNSRARPSTSSVTSTPVALGPASASTSSSSVTSTPRQPTRLTAVPPKPPPPTTTTTHHVAAKRSPPEPAAPPPPAPVASASSSSSPTTTSVVASTAHPSPPHAVSPARQHSSASSESSITSSSSFLHSSTTSTTRTSLSSGGSPTALTELALGAKPSVGGGVMKGKESLKKDKKQKRKDEVAEAVRMASKPGYDHPPLPPPLPPPPPPRPEEEEGEEGENEEVDAEGEVDEELLAGETSTTNASRPLVEDVPTKKKRRLLASGLDSASDASSTTTTTNRSPRIGTPGSSGTTKKRKRQMAKSERWYSSSSESEEGEPGNGRSTPARAASLAASAMMTKRRRTISANDLLLQPSGSDSDRGRSLLRSSTGSSAALPSHLANTAKSSPLRSSSTPTSFQRDLGLESAEDEFVRITSLASFERHRALFNESYPSYKALYETLRVEKRALVEGGKGRYSLDEVTRLVKRLETNRDELERIKLGLKKYAMTAGLAGEVGRRW